MQWTLVSDRPHVADVEANVATLERHVRDASGDVVVFGELFLHGYTARDHFAPLALGLDDALFQRVKAVSKETGKHVITGLARRDEERRGLFYNSMAHVDPSGRVETYDKWFLANFGPFEEKLFFTPGRRLPIWHVGDIRVGPQICYDLFFPELAKAYALQGADVLLNISASPTTSRGNFERMFAARAVENAYFVAYCNLAGSQDDVVYWAGNQVWGPRGDRKALGEYVEPGHVDCEMALGEIEVARSMRPTIRDTRAEMVAALATAFDSMHR